MKRGQMGDAEKHAIRRKIEEKQVLIREQRKVRERLSRECADTVFHIAATESTIKTMTAQHKETLRNKTEDFKYSTAAEIREVQQLTEKCAELERVVTSADVVEREHEVATARLAALRLEDEKEEVAKAREMDALKRNLFNVRNDLENVFRTTLHDLNVAYQDQAFDAMVEEAATARAELPTLRRDLCRRTKNANRVIAKQCGSSAGAESAKAERDLTGEFVKLQAQREKKLRRSIRGQKLVIKKETEEMKDLDACLERFKAGAEELRAAAAELQELRVKSARAQKEYLRARAWAHTLAKKGPKALETELKRRRLAALTAATVASFKAGRTESGLRPAEAAGEDGRGPQEDEAAESSGEADRNGGSSGHDGGSGREDGEEETAEKGDGQPGSGGCISRADDAILLPAERRDTLTLVSGMEIKMLGGEVGAAAAAASSENGPKQTPAISNEGAGDRQPAAASEHHDRDRRWPEDKSERIWRASLYNTRHGQRDVGNTINDIGGVRPDVVTRSSNREGSSSPDGTTSQSADAVDRSTTSGAGERKEGANASQTQAVSSAPHRGAGRREGARASQTQAVSLAPAHVGAGTQTAASRPDKLPPDVLASILLSEHEFVGGRMSAADVLERSRQWEQHQQHHQEQQQRRGQQGQRRATEMLRFPDLPYGFTDLGRRVNVGQAQRRDIVLESTGALAGTASSLE